MRWLMNLLKALLALALLMTLVSWLLPARQHVERQIELPVAPAKVWPWLAEPRRWESWSPWLAKDPATRLTYFGPASGSGAGWRWDSERQGQGSMRFDQAEAPRQLTFTLTFDDMGNQASGSFELIPRGSGCQLVWRLDSDAGWNPIARWFGLALDRLVGPDLEDGLARLAAQLSSRP